MSRTDRSSPACADPFAAVEINRPLSDFYRGFGVGSSPQSGGVGSHGLNEKGPLEKLLAGPPELPNWKSSWLSQAS